MRNPLKITETLLRDAHQSLLATRMRLEDMLPVAGKLDAIGYWSLEVWGGATFDSAMRFLGEDPWERLRALRRACPKSRTQMLLRGQNLVGYRHYPDDIAEHFVVCSRRNGMDVFRIFDALNDVRNMKYTMEVAKREGGHVQATISYTTSPVHTTAAFVEMAEELADLGADSICIKDMAGLIDPYSAATLVQAIKAKMPSMHVQLHTHYTSGMGTAVYLKCAEAGIDCVDTAISSLALSTSQPPTETLVAILKDSERDTGLDLPKLAEIARMEIEVRKKYASFEAGVAPVDVNVLEFQVPGGMLSNLVSQLRQQGAMERYYDVLEEVPKVRADLGYPPLVTPSSQIVGTQATLNVMMGERYKVIPEEVKQYIRGYYGKSPAPIADWLVRKAIGDEQPITCRPADMLAPGWDQAKKEIGDLAKSEEDICSYALFPQIAGPFLARRAKGLGGREEIAAAVAAMMFAQADAKKAQVAGAAGNGTQGGAGVPAWKAAARAALSRGW